MKAIVLALMMGVIVPGAALAADPARSPMIAQAKTDREAVPKVKEARLRQRLAAGETTTWDLFGQVILGRKNIAAEI